VAINSLADLFNHDRLADSKTHLRFDFDNLTGEEFDVIGQLPELVKYHAVN
jgi:hypothetical protein